MNENQQTSAAADPAEDLQIIAGETRVTLSDGEAVTLREYGFMQGMQVDAIASGIVKDLQDLFLSDQQGLFRLQDLARIFGQAPDIMVTLLAMACDRAEDWVRQLSDQDGMLIQLAWWSVNKDFFIRRLVTEAGARAMKAVTPSAGEASSPD